MSSSARASLLTVASLALMTVGVVLARLPDHVPARVAGLLLSGAGLFLLAHALRMRAAARCEAQEAAESLSLLPVRGKQILAHRQPDGNTNNLSP